MNELVFTLLEATINLYPADTKDEAVLSSPVWMGCEGEELRVGESFLSIQTNPSGSLFPRHRPLVPVYHLTLNRLWVHRATDRAVFRPTTGRYVLDILFTSEETGAWYRQTDRKSVV